MEVKQKQKIMRLCLQSIPFNFESVKRLTKQEKDPFNRKELWKQKDISEIEFTLPHVAIDLSFQDQPEKVWISKHFTNLCKGIRKCCKSNITRIWTS